MIIPILLGAKLEVISNEVAMVELAAIIPAAGESQRLQGGNKLLLPVNGAPMIAVVATVAYEAGCSPVIVVTGDDPQLLGGALTGHSALPVNNPEARAGMAGSLVIGMKALPDSADGVVIMLADMPLVTAATVAALCDAFAQAGGEKIVYPDKNGRQGNPVLFPRQHFDEIRGLKGDAGAKGILEKYASESVAVPIESDGIFFDVDTEDDYHRLIERLKH